ncbi:MAG TPA: hypothetical protein PK771_04440 [Spirochaetota bacterium]|nr:hypothetical protein [Spirochaetota bacterium]
MKNDQLVCSGTWTQSDKSGWFEFIMNSKGDSFNGSWGYKDDTKKYNWTGERINSEFTEYFGGKEPNIRFKTRNLKIENGDNVFKMKKGGTINVTMEILHDCNDCGGSVNQIIVGLGGEDKAQVSVWNGMNRSGGSVMIVNKGTDVQAYCEDNKGAAEWVTVYYSLKIPDKKGVYYIRTRYAQDYQGNLLTKEGKLFNQPVFEKVLGWWKVDRPNGPGPESNIGAVIVE